MSEKTEQQLIERARQSLNQCHWEIGECATIWTKKYARGRTDEDFGQLIGMSGDQVYQRRRVYESFHDVYTQYPALSWSHFYVALNWDDAAECLQWAQDLQSSVAEMRAWRRASRGEDLTQPGMGDDEVDFINNQLVEVRNPDSAGGNGRTKGSLSEVEDYEKETVPRISDEPYSPYRKDARGSAPKDGDEGYAQEKLPLAVREPLAAPKLLRKVIKALEMSNELLTEGAIKQIKKEPIELIEKLLELVDSLKEKTDKLS